MKKATTSWEPVQKWYHKSVGEDGHYYHRQIVLPQLLRLMQLNQTEVSAVLDLACGQGVLARSLPKNTFYTGIDISSSLIKEARQLDTATEHHYFVSDITKSLPIKEKNFSHATIVLALQNIAEPLAALRNAYVHLENQGKLFIVLNHPCFRIPRQSSWQVDQERKIQYRRIDRYATSMNIPIQAHPSKGEKSAMTLSFHYPLSDFSRWLNQAGFAIELMEEWCSDKLSTGSAAKMENRSREEFPLFLTIIARKISER